MAIEPWTREAHQTPGTRTRSLFSLESSLYPPNYTHHFIGILLTIWYGKVQGCVCTFPRGDLSAGQEAERIGEKNWSEVLFFLIFPRYLFRVSPNQPRGLRESRGSLSF